LAKLAAVSRFAGAERSIRNRTADFMFFAPALAQDG
jgi:hypothetical protein